MGGVCEAELSHRTKCHWPRSVGSITCDHNQNQLTIQDFEESYLEKFKGLVLLCKVCLILLESVLLSGRFVI